MQLISALGKLFHKNSQHILQTMKAIRGRAFHDASGLTYENFGESMLRRLEMYFPDKTRASERTHLLDLVEYGMNSARGYGLFSLESMSTYISFMFLFGSGFGSDPKYPDARQILTDKTLKNERTKIRALYDATVPYLKKKIVYIREQEKS